MKASPARVFALRYRSFLPKASRPAAFLLLASGLSSALTLGFTVVAARLLAPAHYGSFMALFGLWSVVTMPTATVQLVAARHLAGPDTGETGFRRQMTSLLTATLTATSFLITAAVWLAARALGLSGGVAVGIALQALWLGAFVAWLRGRAQAQESFVRFGLSDVAAAALRLAVLVTLLGTTNVSPAWSLFISVGIGSLAVAAVLPSTFLIRDSAPLETKTIMASAGSSFLVALAFGLLTNLDLLWGHYALGETAGFFAAGTLASRPFILLGAVAGTVVLPKVASGAMGRANLLKTAGLLLAGALALASLAQVLAAPLVTLFFGEGYRAAVGVARLAAWGGALFAPLVMLTNASLGLGSQRMAAGFAVFTAALTVAAFAFAHSSTAFWGISIAASTVYLLLTLSLRNRKDL